MSAQPEVRALDSSEFLVGGTGSYTTVCPCPDVDLDADGNFIIVWFNRASGTGGNVQGQRFTTLGATDGGVFTPSDTVAGGGTQWNPAVSVDDLGDSVVVWQGFGIDGAGTGIGGRLYDDAGTAIGSHFAVNSKPTNSQYTPEIDEDPAGKFVVVWPGPFPASTNTEVRARRFDEDGNDYGNEFIVNTYVTNIQGRPHVGVDDSGRFVVAWHSQFQDGDGYGIFAARFDDTGGVLDAEFPVNTTTTGGQSVSGAAMSPGGQFVIAWESENVDGDFQAAMARVFDNTGTAVTGEIQLNTHTTDRQRQPAVGLDANDNFVAVWMSNLQDGDGYGIFGRAFDSTGAAVTDEFQVNTYTTDKQDVPAIVVDATGNFIVTWRSQIQNAGKQGVYARRYLGPCRESLALTQDQWHLIGLPCEPPAGADTLQDVFGDDLNPGDYQVTWAVFRRNGATNAYELVALSDALSVHVGYWIKTTLAGQTIDVEGNNADYTDIAATSFFATHGGGHDALLAGVAGDCTDTDLSDGRFNMLGHPYRITIPLGGVYLDNAGTEETLVAAEAAGRMMDQIWWWNGAAYQARDSCTLGLEGTLTKWMGYWVNVCDTSSTYEARTPARAYDFCDPPGEPGAPERLVWDGRTLRPERDDPTPGKPKPKHGDPWYLRITATSGTLSDPGNVLGELWDSLAGYDAHDLVELQPFGSPWLTVVFPHSEWGSAASDWYTSDYHGFEDERSWSFEVRSDQARTVTLALELTPLGKKAPGLEIVDAVSGAVVPVEDGGYTFAMASTRHPFTVRETRGGGRK